MVKNILDEIDNYSELISDTLNEGLEYKVSSHLVCECFTIGMPELIRCGKELPSVTLEALQDKLHIGKGCTSCLKVKEVWLGHLDRCLRLENGN